MASDKSDSLQMPLVNDKKERPRVNCFRKSAKWLSEVKAKCVAVLLSPFQDALGDSVVLWFLYVIVSFFSYFLLLYASENEGKNNYIIADTFLICLISVGILVQARCLCKKSNSEFVQFGMLSHEDSTTYLMAGVYVFGTGTLFTILLRLVTYYHAHESILNCQLYNISQYSMNGILNGGVNHLINTNGTKSKVVVLFGGFCYIDVAFDTTRLLFTLLQLCFIQAFRAATFQNSNFVRFTLYHTMMTNGCIWIRYVVDETSLFKHKTYRSSIDEFVAFASKMEELMIPFILEYSLIAAGLLYTIASHMIKRGHSLPTHGSSTVVTREDTTMDNVTGGHNAVIPVRAEETVQQRDHAAPGCQLGLICGVFCGLLLLVSSLTFSTNQNKFNRRSHDFFLAYEGLLAILQIISIFWTLRLLQHHDKNAHTLRTEDTLLLIGFIGTFAFHWATAYSVIKLLADRQENKGSNIFTILHLTVVIISHFLQTVLVIISSRYTLRQEQDLSAMKIRQCILFMLTTNLGFWALDSFVEMKDNASSSYPCGKIVFKDDWITITSLTYPFVVFYRFHSAEMLYDFWSRYRVKTKAHYP